MYPGSITKGLNIPKVIGGISKSLSVANQLIPLYVKAKPLISNAKQAFNVAKEIIDKPNTKNTNIVKKEHKNNNIKKESVKTSLPPKNTNNPVFFL